MSRALRQLEQAGLIARTASAHDGRQRDVALTETGADLMVRAIAVADKNATHFSGKLNPDEQEVLLDLLVKMRDGETTHLETF